MLFTFSFSNKKELIHLKEISHTAQIGSLLSHFIDIDWEAFSMHFQSEFGMQDLMIQQVFQITKEYVGGFLPDDAIEFALQRTLDLESITEELARLQTGKEYILHILEALVDEPQNAYEERLFDIFNVEENSEIKVYFDKLGPANILSIMERNRPAHHSSEEFSFLFETEDLMSLIAQELQYICSNGFYIRKCALCKRFIWTRKMNKVYCDRSTGKGKKTCAQHGPMAMWKEKSPKAYALYWKHRNRLLNRATSNGDHTCYNQWLRQTQIYKVMAKNNEIDSEDMKLILDEIEFEIYHPSVMLPHALNS